MEYIDECGWTGRCLQRHSGAGKDSSALAVVVIVIVVDYKANRGLQNERQASSEHGKQLLLPPPPPPLLLLPPPPLPLQSVPLFSHYFSFFSLFFFVFKSCARAALALPRLAVLAPLRFSF